MRLLSDEVKAELRAMEQSIARVMFRRTREKAWAGVQRYFILALLVTFWQLSIGLGWIEREYLPSPIEILSRLADLVFISGAIWNHFAASMMRLAIGLGITVAVAVPLGLAMGWSAGFSRFVDSIVESIRPIPPIAMIPLAIFYLGIGDASKIFIIMMGTFFPLLLNTITGVKTTDPLLVSAARTLGARTPQVLWRVVVPSAFPYIFTGFRISFGIGLIVLVAAEMVAAVTGLGFFILRAEMTWQLEDMFCGIIMISLTGLMMNALLMRFEARYFGWFLAMKSSS